MRGTSFRSELQASKTFHLFVLRPGLVTSQASAPQPVDAGGAILDHPLHRSVVPEANHVAYTYHAATRASVA